MNILVLCRRIPFPLTDGESLRIYHYAKRLAANHQLDLVWVDGPSRDAELGGIFRRLERVADVPVAPPGALRRLRNTFSIDGYARRYPSVERHLRGVLGARDYQVIWSSADMITTIPAGFSTPLLADICDDDVLMLRRQLARTRGLVARLRMLKRLLMARGYERRHFSSAQACLFVAEADAESFRSLAPATRVAVIPNGVDTEHFAPVPLKEDAATVVFEGSMAFPPNVDAAVYLCRTILPRIVARRPDARVVLVGRDPAPEVRALAGERVQVTGTVDDVRPYLASATVFACPLRMGAGIKNKVLQAWAMGKAVVATPVSVAGLAVEEGKNILVQEDPDEFAAAVVRLIDDPALRARLGSEARQTVVAGYTWGEAAHRLEGLLASIAGKTRRAGPDA